MSDRETQPGSIIPGVDWESGVKRLMGNEQLYRKLLAKFAASYGDAAGRIRDALSAGDRQTAHNELHTLKGVTANLSSLLWPIWSLRRNRLSSTTIRNTKTNVSTP
ncbi:MAG: Hpt domain-containing protein [Bilophila wadsworthia]